MKKLHKYSNRTLQEIYNISYDKKSQGLSMLDIEVSQMIDSHIAHDRFERNRTTANLDYNRFDKIEERRNKLVDDAFNARNAGENDAIKDIEKQEKQVNDNNEDYSSNNTFSETVDETENDRFTNIENGMKNGTLKDIRSDKSKKINKIAKIVFYVSSLIAIYDFILFSINRGETMTIAYVVVAIIVGYVLLKKDGSSSTIGWAILGITALFILFSNSGTMIFTIIAFVSFLINNFTSAASTYSAAHMND